MKRRELAQAFRQWLIERPGYVQASWVHHITGVSKSALTKAASEGRVRVEQYTFPSGRTITLISLQDALRLDVYGRPHG